MDAGHGSLQCLCSLYMNPDVLFHNQTVIKSFLRLKFTTLLRSNAQYNAEYLLALPTLKLLCAKTDRYWLLLVRCLRLAQKTQNIRRLSLTIKITHDKLQIVMNSKLGGSSPRRGEGPEAPSSRSEIRRIRIRSRTITTASWSDCFSQ